MHMPTLEFFGWGTCLILVNKTKLCTYGFEGDAHALPRGVHYDNIRKQRAGKYRVIYIHKRKNLEFS